MRLAVLRRVLLVVLALVAAGNEKASGARAMLAVAGFGHEADDKKAARSLEILQSLLEARLSRDASVTLVERQQIDKVVRELALSRSGLVGRDTALRIGKLTRADLLLYGNTRLVGGERVLGARLVEARTGKIRLSYVRRMREGSAPAVAAELARVVIHAAGAAKPGPTLAIAPFRQARGFDRLVFLQQGLRELLVRDFERQGTFVVLEREDMRALMDEMELARKGFTDEPVGPPPVREAWYFLSGEFDEMQRAGELGIRLRVSLRHIGQERLSERAFERPVDELGDLRSDVVRWVSGRCSVRESPRESDAETEFAVMLDRAVRLMCHMDDVQFDGIPGVERPGWPGGWRRPVQLSASDGRAYDALVEMAVNALECAMFIRAEDPRPRMLLAICLTRPQRWMHERERKPELYAMVGRAEALLKGVISRDREGPYGASARRLLPNVYRFALSHVPSDRERERRKMYSQKYIAALISRYEDTPPELRVSGDAEGLRTAAHHHKSNTYLLGPGAVEAFMRHIRTVVTDRSLTRPNRPQPYVSDLIKCARKTGRLDDAIEFLESLPLDEPKMAYPVLQNLGVAYRQKKAWRKSADCFRKAMKVCDADREGWFGSRYYTTLVELGKTHLAAGDEEAALRCFEKKARDFLAEKRSAGGDLKELCGLLEPLYEKRGQLDRITEICRAMYDRYGWSRREKWLLDRLAKAREHAGKSPGGPARGRLVVERYAAPPKDCSMVGDICVDGPRVWYVAYAGNFGHWGSPRGSRARLYVADVPGKRVRRLTWPGERMLDHASALAVTRDHLWLGTFGEGLLRLDKRSGKWKSYTVEDGLPFNYITALAVREKGGLYVGFGHGDRGGIAMMDVNERFTLLGDRGRGPKPPSKRDISRAMAKADKRTLHEFPAHAPKEWVYCIRATADGLLAVAGHPNRPLFYRYGEKRGEWKNLRSARMVRSVELDPRSGLAWRQTTWSKGASFGFFDPLPGGGWKLTGSFNEDADKRVLMAAPRSAARYAGKIWFAGRNVGKLHSSGLYAFDEKTGEVTIYGPQDGLGFDEAFVVVASGDGLWVGSNKGLWRVRVREEKPGGHR